MDVRGEGSDACTSILKEGEWLNGNSTPEGLYVRDGTASGSFCGCLAVVMKLEASMFE